MPRGTFIPLDNPIRFFARLHSFTLECPFCGRLLMMGKGQRDAKQWNPVTGRVKCPDRPGTKDQQRLSNGCGRQFLVGLVAWPLRPSGGLGPKPQRPPDQIPEPHQLAEIRAFIQGRFAREKKQHGDNGNQIQPLTDFESLEDGTDPFIAVDPQAEDDE